MLTRILMLVVAFSLVGCSAPYVNIPPLQGDAPAMHSPNNGTVATVEAEALKYLIMQDAPPTTYIVQLPEATSEQTYNTVMSRLPDGAIRSADQTTGEPGPFYRVAQVQVRGFSSQVDIVRPRDAGGKTELVSVYLAVDIDGWYASSRRVWRIPVEQALAIVRQQPQPAEASDAAETPEAEAVEPE